MNNNKILFFTNRQEINHSELFQIGFSCKFYVKKNILNQFCLIYKYCDFLRSLLSFYIVTVMHQVIYIKNTYILMGSIHKLVFVSLTCKSEQTHIACFLFIKKNKIIKDVFYFAVPIFFLCRKIKIKLFYKYIKRLYKCEKAPSKMCSIKNEFHDLHLIFNLVL